MEPSSTAVIHGSPPRAVLGQQVSAPGNPSWSRGQSPAPQAVVSLTSAEPLCDSGCTGNSMLKESDLQERSGVKFHGLKTFRRTFARVAKDRGATMEAVLRAMRHKTTKTTERYYARIRADNAF